MKSNKLFILAAAALAALSACNHENVTSQDGPKALSITIQAAIGEMTRVSTSGNTATFETGDKIALYAWTGDKTAVPDTKVVNGVENTLGSDGKWTPATQMLWADMITDHYFLGIYPAKAVTNFTADSFTLQPDKYEESDLLIAVNTTGLKAQDNPVSLTFEHAMAKLYVNLTFRDQWATAPTVSSVTVKARKTADINYLAATPATASGSAEEVPLTSIDNASWSGLQVPQAGVNTITIAIDGKDYKFTHTEDIPLVKGQYTTVNLIVGRNTIDLDSVSISNWSAGSTINGGEAQTND
jgi:hypothetical protein